MRKNVPWSWAIMHLLFGVAPCFRRSVVNDFCQILPKQSQFLPSFQFWTSNDEGARKETRASATAIKLWRRTKNQSFVCPVQKLRYVQRFQDKKQTFIMRHTSKTHTEKDIMLRLNTVNLFIQQRLTFWIWRGNRYFGTFVGTSFWRKLNGVEWCWVVLNKHC